MYMKIEEAAETTGWSPHSVRRFIDQGLCDYIMQEEVVEARLCNGNFISKKYLVKKVNVKSIPDKNKSYKLHKPMKDYKSTAFHTFCSSKFTL